MAVVGGGISGLAAALELASARAAGRLVEPHLFESGGRLGGVIYTDRVEGCLIEAGPDSFLTEKPQALELAAELGLAGDVIGSNDAARRTYILHRGKLAPLPDGLQFLVPTRLLPMLTTPLVPLREKVKMLGELWLKPQAVPEESVASFVARHFGAGMVENIADPLLAGVYGGDSGQLSVQATLPRFVEMEQKHGSLIRAVLRARRGGARAAASAGTPHPPRPLFSTLKGGLAQMVEAIRARLDPRGLHCGTAIASLELVEVGGRRTYSLLSAGRIFADFDAVVLALPAHEAARLLRALDSEMARLLAGVPYSSSATVALGYPARVRSMLPPGFGFLAPRKERCRLLACTFVHSKFPERVPPDRTLLRCFLGGSRDEAILELDDERIVELAQEELRGILGLVEPPLFARVYRWPRAMAQYTLGHQQRIAGVRQRLAGQAGLFLAGNWDSGIGISDCIRSGRSAAAGCLRYPACAA